MAVVKTPLRIEAIERGCGHHQEKEQQQETAVETAAEESRHHRIGFY
jgi:hypothetical protein